MGAEGAGYLLARHYVRHGRAHRREPVLHRMNVTAKSILIAFFCLSLSCIASAQAAPGSEGGKISPFGIGADDHTSRNLKAWIPQMAEIGVRNMRACRTLWSDVEPKEGQWRWTQLDGQLTYLASEHMECWGLLYGGVAWNTKDRPGGFPNNNLEAWKTYVFETVKHAHGRIRYWEVWNEPPNGTNSAPPADYGKLMAATYEAAKAADPECHVGMAAQSVNLNYLEQAIKAGARDHFDYITLHPYETMGSVEDNWGTEAVFMHIAPTVRKMLAAQDPARKDAPVWFTEIGYDAGKSAARQAEALVKAYTMSIAEGIQAINWFEGLDGDSGPMGLLEKEDKPRPAYMALATMIKLMGTSPQYLGWVMLKGRDYGFVFRADGRTVLVAWASGETKDQIGFTSDVQVTDPQTGHTTTARSAELSSSPLLIEGMPAALIAQAQKNKLRPFPWDGDYSHAKTVYVRMGEKTVEKGLHPQQGDAVRADVVAYGGSARAGNVAGGPVFIVDPNFLSYDSTPIEITAVVRRTPENHPAKLALEYESTSGYRKLPAFVIPGNKKWYTARWTINDAEFVSKWVFNFRFDLGEYYIKSVSVTKLKSGK